MDVAVWSVWDYFCEQCGYVTVCQWKDLFVDLLFFDLLRSKIAISCCVDYNLTVSTKLVIIYFIS